MLCWSATVPKVKIRWIFTEASLQALVTRWRVKLASLLPKPPLVGLQSIVALSSVPYSFSAAAPTSIYALNGVYLVVASRSVGDLIHANLGRCLVLIRGLLPTQPRCIHHKRLCFPIVKVTEIG